MEVSRNSEVKKSPLRTKTFNNKPNDNILWIFLLDLLMKPQFEQYIRWTGKDLEFIIINEFVVFTEFEQRKWSNAEPTPLGEDPGVRWAHCLVDTDDVNNRIRGLRSENYNRKDEPERTDKPWIKKIDEMRGGYSFTTSISICNKLQMPIEQLLQYARGVGSKYDYPKIRNNKTKKSNNGSTEKTENKKTNKKKSAFPSNVDDSTKQLSLQSDNLLLEQQYVGPHPYPPNYGISTHAMRPNGQLSQDKQLLSEHHSPQNWNIADILQDNVNFEERNQGSPNEQLNKYTPLIEDCNNAGSILKGEESQLYHQYPYFAPQYGYTPSETQLPLESECTIRKTNVLEKWDAVSDKVLKRKVGLQCYKDQQGKENYDTAPMIKKLKESPYTVALNIPQTIPEPKLQLPFIDELPVGSYVRSTALPGWNYPFTDEQHTFYPPFNPRCGLFSPHLPILQNPIIATEVVQPSFSIFGPANISTFHIGTQPNNEQKFIPVVLHHHPIIEDPTNISNPTNSNVTKLTSSPVSPSVSNHSNGASNKPRTFDFSVLDNISIEQESLFEPPSQSNIDLQLKDLEDCYDTNIDQLCQYVLD